MMVVPNHHVGTVIDAVLRGSSFMIGKVKWLRVVSPVETRDDEIGALSRSLYILGQMRKIRLIWYRRNDRLPTWLK
jgi:hypothetical protein